MTIINQNHFQFETMHKPEVRKYSGPFLFRQHYPDILQPRQQLIRDHNICNSDSPCGLMGCLACYRSLSKSFFHQTSIFLNGLGKLEFDEIQFPLPQLALWDVHGYCGTVQSSVRRARSVIERAKLPNRNPILGVVYLTGARTGRWASGYVPVASLITPKLSADDHVALSSAFQRELDSNISVWNEQLEKWETGALEIKPLKFSNDQPGHIKPSFFSFENEMNNIDYFNAFGRIPLPETICLYLLPPLAFWHQAHIAHSTAQAHILDGLGPISLARHSIRKSEFR